MSVSPKAGALATGICTVKVQGESAAPAPSETALRGVGVTSESCACHCESE